jgi:flagellar basal-body rod modification protein FlgD
MTPGITSNSGTAGSGSTPATQPPAVNKNMFMQLLVAQLRNQDPMSPSDGTQFIGQLAQFQQLEQSVNTGSDITAIRQDLDQLVLAGTKS